jgi:hypothetical protein
VQKIESDSLRIQVIEALLSSFKEALITDSLLIQNMAKQLSDSFKIKSPGLSPSALVALQSDLQTAFHEFNSTDKALNNLREKMALLESYKLEIIEAQKARSRFVYEDAPGELIRLGFEGRTFLSLYALAGRHMPAEISDPGPDLLFGGGGGLSWFKLLDERLMLEAQISYANIQWKYNQDTRKQSRENTATSSLLLQYPLLADPSLDSTGHLDGGGVLLIGIGPAYQYSHRSVHDGILRTNQHLHTWGGQFSSRFAFSLTPISIDITYRYFNDQTGELYGGFSLPLNFIPRIGGNP